MKIENEVPSLELCKQLKEAGWPQDKGLYWWQQDNYNFSKWYIEPEQLINEALDECWCVAPTSVQLLEELPAEIDQQDNYSPYYFNLHVTDVITDCDKAWQIRYGNAERGSNTINIIGEFLPNALAKMWLYLKQEGLLGGKG